MVKQYEKFKVGDKVKPKDLKWKHGDGEIVKVDRIRHWVCVQYNVSVCVLCNDEGCRSPETRRWHKMINIKRVVIKNVQSLFNFMK